MPTVLAPQSRAHCSVSMISSVRPGLGQADGHDARQVDPAPVGGRDGRRTQAWPACPSWSGSGTCRRRRRCPTSRAREEHLAGAAGRARRSLPCAGSSASDRGAAAPWAARRSRCACASSVLPGRRVHPDPVLVRERRKLVYGPSRRPPGGAAAERRPCLTRRPRSRSRRQVQPGQVGGGAGGDPAQTPAGRSGRRGSRVAAATASARPIPAATMFATAASMRSADPASVPSARTGGPPSPGGSSIGSPPSR